MKTHRNALLESFVRRKTLDTQLNQFSASIVTDCLPFIPIEAVVFELQPLYYSLELQIITNAIIK